jgi:hypothetical protein
MPVVFRFNGIRFHFFSNEGIRENRSTSTLSAEIVYPKFGFNPNQD